MKQQGHRKNRTPRVSDIFGYAIFNLDLVEKRLNSIT